jgi:hypothetical protein
LAGRIYSTLILCCVVLLDDDDDEMMGTLRKLRIYCFHASNAMMESVVDYEEAKKLKTQEMCANKELQRLVDLMALADPHQIDALACKIVSARCRVAEVRRWVAAAVMKAGQSRNDANFQHDVALDRFSVLFHPKYVKRSSTRTLMVDDSPNDANLMAEDSTTDHCCVVG